MQSEIPQHPTLPNLPISSRLSVFVARISALQMSSELDKSTQIPCAYEALLQNKPNFKKRKNNANPFITKPYNTKPPPNPPKKQTQSNPISPRAQDDIRLPRWGIPRPIYEIRNTPPPRGTYACPEAETQIVPLASLPKWHKESTNPELQKLLNDT